MKKIQILIGFTWILGLFVLALTIADFLALHDIRQDYVSKETLNVLGNDLNIQLPDWTETRGEWAIVEMSYLSRFVFLVINTFTIAICFLFLGKNDRHK